jgi:hypothetical protein
MGINLYGALEKLNPQGEPWAGVDPKRRIFWGVVLAKLANLHWEETQHSI